MPLMAWKSSSGCSEILQGGGEGRRGGEGGVAREGKERESEGKRTLSVVFLSTFWCEGEQDGSVKLRAAQWILI